MVVCQSTWNFLLKVKKEIGSLHVEQIVKEKQSQTSRRCFVSGKVVAKNYVDNYQIVGGMRGITVFDVETTTADIDLHSSLASYAENAAWRLVRGLATLRDDTGKVLVEGFMMMSNR